MDVCGASIVDVDSSKSLHFFPSVADLLSPTATSAEVEYRRNHFKGTFVEVS